MPSYAELHCISNFSFLRGASHPGELVAEAARLGYRALAITDECSLAGVVRAHEAARAHPQLRLIIGSEFALPAYRLVALVQDRIGYRQLATLITVCRRRAAKGCYDFSLDDVQRPGIDGLSQCLMLLVPGESPCWSPNLNLDLAQVKRCQSLFGSRLWLGLSVLLGPDDALKTELFFDFSVRLQIPMLACGQVHMHARERRALQDVLTATRLNRPVADCVAELHANGERHLRPISTLAQLYHPDLLANSVCVAEQCQFSLDELRYQYPHEVVPPGKTPIQHLT